MKELSLVLVLALMLCACSETGTSDGRLGSGGVGGTGGTSGMGGTVEPPPPPQAVDETCRDWCANEGEGASCHEGPFESVQPCYESCLATYQQEVGRQCGDEWIAIKNCQLDLGCADLFGDCDSTENAYSECVTRASDREYCAGNCPDLDPNECDTAKCQANQYCESACPTLDRNQCIEQRISVDMCEHHEAVSQCRQYCAGQDLNECVSQWLADGRCEFNDGFGACISFCEPIGSASSVCADYWEQNGECPPPGTGGTGGTGGMGGTGGNTIECVFIQCAGRITACGDCTDNDGDGLIDNDDPECLGPCDNYEGADLLTGVGGETGEQCKVDCYFDFGNGTGNDDCHWHRSCDPLEPKVQCIYDESKLGGMDCPLPTQSTLCDQVCAPLTPNGCDCFGCCTFPELQGGYVYVGSEQGCTFATVTDPDHCQPCTPAASCLNTCERCEVCLGKPTIPSDCFPPGGGTRCPPEKQECGLPGDDPCPAGDFCVTGCCTSA